MYAYRTEIIVPDIINSMSDISATNGVLIILRGNVATPLQVSGLFLSTEMLKTKRNTPTIIVVAETRGRKFYTSDFGLAARNNNFYPVNTLRLFPSATKLGS